MAIAGIYGERAKRSYATKVGKLGITEKGNEKAFGLQDELSEQLSYLFFGLPFGFWDDKCNKYGAGKGNAGEYEVAGGRVDGVSEGGNHVGDGKGDQPVEGGADGGRYPLGGEDGNLNPEERPPHTNLPYPVSVPGLPIHPNANGKNNIEKANDIKH